MPRRKKLPVVPDIVGTGRSPENMLVQKTNPLLSLSETGLTLAEFKILDSYLGRIESHSPDKRNVQFGKGELESLLGVTKINYQDLEKRIDNLFRIVTIRDKEKERGFVKIALFERAECYKDESGLWNINLAASQAAMEYIFYPERLGYLRYNLQNVVRLTSRYSYVLYLYLEQHRHMSLTWEVPLGDLKRILNCTASSYDGFKAFNKDILKRCFKELNDKTTCHFTYETIRRGKTVIAVRFTLEPLHKSISLSHTPGSSDENNGERQHTSTLYLDLVSPELTAEELNELHDLASKLVPASEHDNEALSARIVRASVSKAKDYKARNIYRYAKQCIINEYEKAAREAEKMERQENENRKRAREDMARVQKLLEKMNIMETTNNESSKEELHETY